MEHLRITVAGKAYDVIVEKIDGGLAGNPAPAVRSAAPAPAASAPAASAPAAPAPAAPAPAAPAAPKGPASAGDVTSPLAGLVQAIDVEVGSTVNVGDLVITLEAMKMYTPINAPAAGKIQALHVKVGDAVEEGQVLYTIG
jgi:biotin carboxyl carrier protein